MLKRLIWMVKTCNVFSGSDAKSEADSMPPDVVSMSRWIEKAEKFSNSSYGDSELLREASM
jgi:hypothetical protein